MKKGYRSLGVCLLFARFISWAHPQDGLTPQETVDKFLKAWIGSDLEAMYALLDRATQSQVRLEQLRKAFIFETTPESHEVLGTLLLADMGRPWFHGRPAQYLQTQIAQSGRTKASVDLKVQVTFASRTGIDPVKLFFLLFGDENPFLSFIPEPDRTRIKDQLEQHIQANKEGTSAVLFYWGMALPELQKGDLIDTAKGQKETFSGGFGDMEIILNLHRYTLVRENDSWKITNAITVRKVNEISKGVQKLPPFLGQELVERVFFRLYTVEPGPSGIIPRTR